MGEQRRGGNEEDPADYPKLQLHCHGKSQSFSEESDDSGNIKKQWLLLVRDVMGSVQSNFHILLHYVTLSRAIHIGVKTFTKI